LYQKFCPVNAS